MDENSHFGVGGYVTKRADGSPRPTPVWWLSVGLLLLVIIVLLVVVVRRISAIPAISFNEIAQELTQNAARASFKEITRIPSPSGRLAAVVLYKEEQIPSWPSGQSEPSVGIEPKSLIDVRLADGNRTIRSYDISELRSLEHVMFSEDEKLVAMAGEGGVIVADVQSGILKVETPHWEPGGPPIKYTHMAFANGKRLLSLDTANTIWVWSTADWNLKLKGTLTDARLIVQSSSSLDCDDIDMLTILNRVSASEGKIMTENFIEPRGCAAAQ